MVPPAAETPTLPPLAAPRSLFSSRPAPAPKTPAPSSDPGAADNYLLKHPKKERTFGDRVQELARSMLSERIPDIDKDDVRVEQNGITSDIAQILHHHGLSESYPSARKQVRQFRKQLRTLIDKAFGENKSLKEAEQGQEPSPSTLPPAAIEIAISVSPQTVDLSQLMEGMGRTQMKLFEGIDPDQKHSVCPESLRHLTDNFVHAVLNEYNPHFDTAQLRDIQHTVLGLIYKVLEESGSTATTASIRTKNFEKGTRELVEDHLGPTPHQPEITAHTRA